MQTLLRVGDRYRSDILLVGLDIVNTWVLCVAERNWHIFLWVEREAHRASVQKVVDLVFLNSFSVSLH